MHAIPDQGFQPGQLFIEVLRHYSGARVVLTNQRSGFMLGIGKTKRDNIFPVGAGSVQSNRSPFAARKLAIPKLLIK